jgi:signal transduction histidine kinase
VFFQRPGSQRNGLKYTLLVVFPDSSTHTFAIEDAPITIGRSPNATVCVNEESVSRQHCMVTPSSGRLMLLDQGSTNGTKVNGKKVKRARLSHGDVLEVGTTRIRVQARTGEVAAVAVDGDGGARELEERKALTPPLPHEQLLLLKRLISRLSVCRSAESAGAVLAEAVLEVFPAERVIVVTSDAAKVGVDGTILAMKRRGAKVITKLELDPSVIKRVIASGRAERHIASSGKTLADQKKLKARRSTHPILCAPLRDGLEPLGVLYLDAPEMPDWVGTAESLSLLSAFGDLAGLALGQGRLERHSSLLVERETPALNIGLRETAKSDGMRGQGTQSIIRQLSDLGELTREQREAVQELELNFERCVDERAEVIEEQRIELAARLAELEHSQQARAIMSRGLVHDIRNLVSALTANLSFVQFGLAPGSEESESLDAAHHCAKKIISMAEDVLDVSRMEEGTFPVEMARISVWGLLTEVMRRHAAQAREAAVELVLGDVERDLHLLADGDVLSRVLDNLVDNALRYAGAGGRVRLEAQRGRASTELLVIDSGPGIDPAQRDKVFNEWVSGAERSVSRHHGIGLYFCRLAAEAHGGAIRVEGQSGDNRIVVSLPSLDDPPMASKFTTELDDDPTTI